jgi:hypothetical protein
MNQTFIFRFRDIIYIAIIILLLLFRSSEKTQKKDIIQHEKNIDSIQFEIKNVKQQIPVYEKANLDSITAYKPNDIDLFFAKRYNNKNAN